MLVKFYLLKNLKNWWNDIKQTNFKASMLKFNPEPVLDFFDSDGETFSVVSCSFKSSNCDEKVFSFYFLDVYFDDYCLIESEI